MSTSLRRRRTSPEGAVEILALLLAHPGREFTKVKIQDRAEVSYYNVEATLKWAAAVATDQPLVVKVPGDSWPKYRGDSAGIRAYFARAAGASVDLPSPPAVEGT